MWQSGCNICAAILHCPIGHTDNNSNFSSIGIGLPQLLLITQCASCGTAYCNRSCLWVWVCYHDNSKLCASIVAKLAVGKGSDHLQLIKFWPSRTPRKGVCGGAKIFGLAFLQPVRSVCVSSERVFHLLMQPSYVYFSHFSLLLVNDFKFNEKKKNLMQTSNFTLISLFGEAL